MGGRARGPTTRAVLRSDGSFFVTAAVDVPPFPNMTVTPPLRPPRHASFYRFHISRDSTASSYLSLIQFNSKSIRPFVQKKAGEKSPALITSVKKLPYADITLESLVEETLKYSGFLDSH